MITGIIGFFAFLALADVIFLVVQTCGEGAAGIVSWICYPFFGLLPLPLFTGLVVRICEGAAVAFFLGHLF